MALKAAFIFLAPEVNPDKDRQIVVTPQVELTVVAANNYKEAESVALKLSEEGIEALMWWFRKQGYSAYRRGRGRKSCCGRGSF